MKQVRVGVVGMGIGRHNAMAIAKHPRGRVTALCDLLEERTSAFAEELAESVTCYTDYREMCRSDEIDAVFVGTPNQFHVPVAREAIRHCKNVLLTKPLAGSVDAARLLVQEAEASGLINMMSLSTRFSDDVAYLGQLAEQGEFDELYYARARSVRRSGIPAWSFGFIEEGGGAFRDMGVHVLDSAWWLLGMPKPVSVMGVSGAKFGPRGAGYFGPEVAPTEELAARYAADDYAGGFIRFENGVGLQVESFWASHQPPELQIELFGTKMGATLRPVTLFRTVNGQHQDVSVDLPERETRPWEAIADHFIACILDDVPCQAPLRHGLIVQEMMEALLESAATGKEVRLD